MLRYSTITTCDINNGPGFRVSLFTQGCSLHCPGCHNPELWDFKGGHEFNQDVFKELYTLVTKPYIDGLTILGGEPMDQYNDLYKLLIEFKCAIPSLNIWLYTGYTLEQLKEQKKISILRLVDTLVDGPYKEELRDTSLAFRGSSNQQIRDKEFIKSYLNGAGYIFP